jgi:hypothetical protein
MSHISSSFTSESFQLLFNAALQDYANQTGTKLYDHPIASQLEKCDSIDSIMSILQDHSRKFREFRGEDTKIVKSLKGAVGTLYALSTSAAGIGLVSPKSLIFIYHPTCALYSHFFLQMQYSLLSQSCSTCVSFIIPIIYCRKISVIQAVKDVSASYDALVDLFESIQNFLSRLDIYTKITLTPAMTTVIVKIMVEILSTLALATKQVKQGRLSESFLTNPLLSLNAAQRNSSKNFSERMR